MFPVLADHEIQVIEQNRKRHLAGVELAWQFRVHTATSTTEPSRAHWLSRTWETLTGAVAGLDRGGRPVGVSGKGTVARA
jgi:hypothetical protein